MKSHRLVLNSLQTSNWILRNTKLLLCYFKWPYTLSKGFPISAYRHNLGFILLINITFFSAKREKKVNKRSNYKTHKVFMLTVQHSTSLYLAHCPHFSIALFFVALLQWAPQSRKSPRLSQLEKDKTWACSAKLLVSRSQRSRGEKRLVTSLERIPQRSMGTWR